MLNKIISKYTYKKYCIFDIEIRIYIALNLNFINNIIRYEILSLYVNKMYKNSLFDNIMICIQKKKN